MKPLCKQETWPVNYCASTYRGANAPVIEKLSTLKIIAESFCLLRVKGK
jgi:hypothetical protein